MLLRLYVFLVWTEKRCIREILGYFLVLCAGIRVVFYLTLTELRRSDVQCCIDYL
eukprot:c32963_g1_i1 orf=3-164(-)